MLCASSLLELLKPGDARFDVPDDTPEFMQVARFQVGLQALEQRFDGGPGKVSVLEIDT